MDMEHPITEGSFTCGSPQTVVEQIKKIAVDAGADTFLGEFTFGLLEQKQPLRHSAPTPNKLSRCSDNSQSTR